MLIDTAAASAARRESCADAQAWEMTRHRLFAYPAKIWVSGKRHEWAKQQACKAGFGFTALSNGFAACDDPDGLQAI